MLGRITHRTTAATSLANLQLNQARQAKLQEQLTSGKSLTKASDDPAAAGEALRHRSDIAVNEQYGRAINDGQTWLTVQEGALESASNLLRSAKAAALKAASTGNHGDAARAAIASEIKSIKESLLGQANTKHLGRPLFAGTAVVSNAFDPATGEFLGNTGQIQRRVADGVDVPVNVSGTIFGTGASSTPADNVFKALDALALAIQSGDATAATAQVGNIDAALTRVVDARGTVGARMNQLESHQEASQARGDFLTNALDEVEGIDIAKVMVEYRLQETAYQAALAATAKTIQPTLLDFLR